LYDIAANKSSKEVIDDDKRAFMKSVFYSMRSQLGYAYRTGLFKL
jgi:hypothetical protein